MSQRANWLLGLIDGLRTYAGVGVAPETPTEIDVEELIDYLWQEVGISGFTLERAVPSEPVVVGRTPVTHILSNLIANAVHHHHRAEGRIKVSVGRHLDGVQIVVEDDGPGVEARYREYVLEALTTLQPRDRGGRSGLGLAIVKRFVDQLGGSIVLDDSELGGLRVTVRWSDDGAAGLADLPG